MPKKLLYYRLRILAALTVLWLAFGVIFFFNLIKPTNDLGVHVSLIQFAFTFGIIGCIISAILIFYLKPAFHHMAVWKAILSKLFIIGMLFFFIAFILLMIYFFVHYRDTLEHYFNSFFTKIVYTNSFGNFIADLTIMTLLSIISLEVTDKYGPGMFWSMIKGEYMKPKVEDRIFIFLDINESTSIAEVLGHEDYFRMLRDFFNHVTISVLANDGAIYQYVGDEIVVNWPNTSENKIKSLKFIRNTFYLLERYSKFYMNKYGVAPTFKAGVHAGEVTAGFVGIVKRDLIYCGDIVNTASRIRSMCNELNESYLLSQDFMQDFPQPFGYNINEIGKLDIKGKSEPMKLHSLKFENTNNG